MKQFKVLDRNLILHQNYLLEASAGTGKTFSIQNIVVRLLIESKGKQDPLLLQQILVVTFTRAATRDLKMRIRSNINQALQFLQSSQLDPHFSSSAVPDYLLDLIEQGEDAVKEASKRLNQALFTFDLAPIFTIHGFCSRMLRQFAIESDMGLHSLSGDEALSQSDVMEIIRDFFRTHICLENYSPYQLEILLKGDPHQRKLLRLVQSLYAFPIFPSFKEVYLKICAILLSLKHNFGLHADKMIEDFKSQAGAYKNHKGAENKSDTLRKIEEFAKLFDKEEWTTQEIDRLLRNGIVWLKALDEELLKGKPIKRELLHYPDLSEALSKELKNVVEEAGDFSFLLTRLSRDCQQLLQRYKREEEKLSHDDVLKKMEEALKQSSFLSQVLERYQAAIIDEFQDTDPLQWQIFSSLFLSDSKWKGSLYLVGDPKQSIYSFRQADIYTYLAAAAAIGEQHCFSLTVNFRSSPQLVQALNALFSQEHLPCFIPLPKHSSSLLYHPVQAASKTRNSYFDKAVHFCIADSRCYKNPKLSDLEREVFFPFISQEILKLKKEHCLPFSAFAILVRDRHQALRLAEYLDQFKIPYLNQRGMNLSGSPAHKSLIDLMRAVLHPYDRGKVRTALSTPLMGWTEKELKTLDHIESSFLLMHRLRAILLEKGFAHFFQTMLHSICKSNEKTILEQILIQEEGKEFYSDLRQLADIVINHQYLEWHGPEGIIPFLDHLHIWEENEDPRIKRLQDPALDGVKILTLHFSKGLEFEVVFALGLVNRSQIKEELIPVEIQNQLLLSPASQTAQEYLAYCEECDGEKMRQLYVALTRAKIGLYIPIALNLAAEKIQLGEASPLELFMARLLQKSPSSYLELYERIKSGNHHPFLKFLDEMGKKNFITYSIHEHIPFDPPKELPVKEAISLQEPQEIIIFNKPFRISSFSILNHKGEKQGNRPKAPFDYICQEKTVHTLPANHETGLLMHRILEKLPFHEFQDSDSEQALLSFIRPFVQKTPFSDWELVIARLIFNALKTSLGSFCLADLKPAQLYREMPFMFSSNQGDEIEEIVSHQGIVQGVIDLLFYHEGRYYLLDWKTNWLGINEEAYHFSDLQNAMEENGYLLQIAIYIEAIKRYLKLVEKRPFEECFGGIIYLFLRGMHPSSQNGIWFNRSKSGRVSDLI